MSDIHTTQQAWLTPERTARLTQVYDAIRTNIEQVIRGKDDVVRLALTCLFAGGHLLIEDVPGVGKTSLAKALAGSIDATWHRIQFTPDLLPSDITGVSVWNQQSQRFEFRPGGVFANLVVGDEINRASPKTQSALLEVMEERQVTVDAVAHPVPELFMVIATQNPIDLEGTYRLPEAQLDRFLMRIAVGYPDDAAEVEILHTRALTGGPGRISPAVSLDEVRAMIEWIWQVHVATAVSEYIAAIAKATRGHPALRLGLSPRGSLALLRAAQAHAASDGRGYVVPDDVKTLARPVATHRMLLTPEAEVQGRQVDDVVDEILGSVPVPTPALVR